MKCSSLRNPASGQRHPNRHVNPVDAIANYVSGGGFPIHPEGSFNPWRRLTDLKQRLDRVSRSWSVEDYWALIHFHVRIIPRLLDARRCTVYVMEAGTDRICSILGTGLKKTAIEPPMDGSIAGKVISTGKPVIANHLDRREGFHTLMDARTGFVTRNMICAPIRSLTGSGVTGAVQVLNRNGTSGFTEKDLKFLEELSAHLSVSIESISLNREIIRISDELKDEVEKYAPRLVNGNLFIAESKGMKDVLRQVRMLSQTPVNVFIHGENGVGKELIARMIHAQSDRRDGPFVAVNCASIPDSLMESEFFGYEKGAFTGAVSSRKGYFEEACGGVLFLDEIADMPLSVQPKFLRAIQEGEGYRLGRKHLIRYDLRIISATNRDLAAEVAAGRFREDLFFRLFSVEIHVPPLRERQADIVPMSMAFLEEVRNRFRKEVREFSPDVLDGFESYTWPGNVRQLRREVERLVALTPPGERIGTETLSPDLKIELPRKSSPETKNASAADVSLPAQVRELEICRISEALRKTGGNRTRSAERLGITRQGLYKKMKRYGMTSDYE